jgi:hypothetical protein
VDNVGNVAGNKQTAEEIEKLKAIAVAAAETVYHYKLIGRAVGRSEDALRVWRDEDEDFSARLEQGRSRFIEKNMKAAKPEFLLERLEPELFKERKEEVVDQKIIVETRHSERNTD